MAAGPHDPDEPGEKSTRPPDARSEPPGAGQDGAGSSGSPGHDTPDADRSGPEDIDARWQQIVAELGDLDELEDLGGLEASAPDELDPSRTGRHGTGHGDDGDRPGLDDGSGPEGAEPGLWSGPRSWQPDPALEEAEDHFVPPDPGPVLGGDPLLTMAWVAAVGVPVLLIVVGVVWRDVPMSWLAGAGAVFLAGVGLLLWRMPHGDDDDPYDDDPGAVV